VALDASAAGIAEKPRGIGLEWSGVELREVGEKAQAAMGRLFLMHLDGNVYSCKHCKTHLGVAGDIISKVPLDPSASVSPL
jgi:hypothetical protein